MKTSGNPVFSRRTSNRFSFVFVLSLLCAALLPLQVSAATGAVTGRAVELPAPNKLETSLQSVNSAPVLLGVDTDGDGVTDDDDIDDDNDGIVDSNETGTPSYDYMSGDPTSRQNTPVFSANMLNAAGTPAYFVDLD